MLETFLILAAAFGFGAMHACEPDHMAAVSTFVARRPTPREAMGFGVRWAIGHGLSLLIIGSILFVLKMALEQSQPVLFSSGVLDRFVGIVLVMLGLWTLHQLRPGTIHHTHDHAHDALPNASAEAGLPASSGSAYRHADGTVHSHSHHGHAGHHHGEGGHKHGSLLMGMLHGAAGTGAFVAQAALALSDTSYAMVFAYTLSFSVGVLVAMALYAGLFGGVLAWGGRKGARVMHGACVATGLLTCGIGACLIMQIELPGVFFFIEH